MNTYTYTYIDEDFQNAWDELLADGVEEQTLEIVTNINGESVDTLRDVLYAFNGENTFAFEEE